MITCTSENQFVSKRKHATDLSIYSYIEINFIKYLTIFIVLCLLVFSTFNEFDKLTIGLCLRSYY